jgi:hypothetical protein
VGHISQFHFKALLFLQKIICIFEILKLTILFATSGQIGSA